MVDGWTTQLKNIDINIVKLDRISPWFGVKIKSIWNQHLGPRLQRQRQQLTTFTAPSCRSRRATSSSSCQGSYFLVANYQSIDKTLKTKIT